MRFAAIIAGLIFPLLLSAQTTLTDWNRMRLKRTERSMTVLGSWAIANIGVGLTGSRLSGGQQRAFHQMNAGWGLINLGLAASGWWTARRDDPSDRDAWASMEALQRTERTFLFNAGLDMAYVAGGFWMQEKAKNSAEQRERWQGFGKSIVLQGGFLFVFDLGAWYYHHTLNRSFRQIYPLQTVQVDPAGNGIGLTIQF